MPKTYTIADKEEAKKLIGRKVKVVECVTGSDHNGQYGTLREVHKEGKFVFHALLLDGELCCAQSFQLVEKTLDDIEVGDVLLDKDFDAVTVLARVNDLVAISEWNKPEQLLTWQTLAGIKKYGYTLKDSSPEKVEKSVAELEKELGMSSGTLRIKKD